MLTWLNCLVESGVTLTTEVAAVLLSALLKLTMFQWLSY